ncbi:hypothetical protein L596_004747 [Steinernema carpocapsae]|uniref:OCEL domain-containing protein n=1 Tax=Steinernema carpocapsae TaxID=34508 RepID=A0A4U8UWR6_STECR|nr:hypothetical protein L596_004747 [Steinernema carpocapsae]
MNGSPTTGSCGANVNLDVNHVEDQDNGEIAFHVKFTDECLEAINNAIGHKTPITFSNNRQNGVFFKIGSGASAQKFRVGSQPNPEGSSAVMYDEASNKYKNVAGIHTTKLQVQATERSFTDTRVKAQKMIEEDKRKKTKDVQSQSRYQKPVVSMVSRPSNYSGSRPVSASSSFKARSTPETLSGTPKPSQPASNSTPPVNRPTMSAHLRQELMRKSMRVRVLHLLATAKYPTADDVVAKVARDGFKDANVDESATVRQLIEDLSDKNTKGDRITLKSQYFPEINMSWPWFSTEEKRHVRIAIAANSNSSASSNFAPTRNSRVAPVQAPSAPAHATPNEKDHSSPSKSNASTPNLPKKLIPGNVAKPEKKSPVKSTSPKVTSSKQPSPKVSPPGTKFAIPVVPSPATSKSPEEKSGSTPGAPKRRIANQSNHGAPVEKKSRTSPPAEAEVVEKPKKETPAPKKKKEASESTTTTPKSAEKEKETGKSSSKQSTGTTVSKTTIPKKKDSAAAQKLKKDVQDARELIDNPQPSKDWELVYGKIENDEDCEKYFTLFNQDHGEYLQAFHRLQIVMKEFEDLGKDLHKVSSGTKEHQVADKQIHDRFLHYLKDKEFLTCIQRHKDLSVKLEVLRKRIEEYHSAHGLELKVDVKTGTGDGVKV